MRVQVSTSEYQFSHGKQPRGSGYWAFFFDNEPEPMFYAGTYAVAKRTAVAYAVTKGFSTVKVGP